MTLTQESAIKLLGMYPKGVWVRIPPEYTSKTRSKHKGHGRLVSVNGGIAEVLPARHRHTVKHQISVLALWKSRTLALNGAKMEDLEAAQEPPYVIVSPYGCFWDGKAFVDDTGKASLYDNDRRCRQALSMLKRKKSHPHLDRCGAVRVDKVAAWLVDNRATEEEQPVKAAFEPVKAQPVVHAQNKPLRAALEEGIAAVELAAEAFHSLALAMRKALEQP